MSKPYRHRFVLIGIILGGVVFGAGLLSGASKSQALSTRTMVNEGICPFKTAEEWQRFLETYADNQKWVATCEDSSCDAKYYRSVKTNLKEVFDSCGSFIEAHPKIAQCTANFRKFVPAWMQQHSPDSYGFTVDNHTYLKGQEASDKPRGMMTPPQVIVDALPSREAVEEAARKNGLKYLTHDSAIDGVRTFVFHADPEGRFDQWMLLNLNDANSPVGTDKPLSILTVQKKDADGKKLPRIRLHFRDYNLISEGEKYKLVVYETNNGKCYSCHVSGVRQLIARRTPILQSKPSRGEEGFDEAGDNPPTDFAFSRLMEFNRKLRSYGTPDWDSMILPQNHGPALGQVQGCTDCHDGKSRAVLNVSTSQIQLEKKIFYELSMPYDTDLPKFLERYQMKNPELSEAEVQALRKAFETHKNMIFDYENSRLPALKKWLLEVPCSL